MVSVTTTQKAIDSTVVPPSMWFCFLWFQLPVVNHGLEAGDAVSDESSGQ